MVSPFLSWILRVLVLTTLDVQVKITTEVEDIVWLCEGGGKQETSDGTITSGVESCGRAGRRNWRFCSVYFSWRCQARARPLGSSDRDWEFAMASCKICKVIFKCFSQLEGEGEEGADADG